MAVLTREDRLSLLQKLPGLPEQLGYKIVRAFRREDVEACFHDDAWAANYALNLWEYVNRVDRLETYPWNIALPIADVCNARCTFCNSWLRGQAIMKPQELERFLPLLPTAKLIGFQGHGEPLVNPHLRELLAQVSAHIDNRAIAYIITNALHLEKHLDMLVAARVVGYNVSLNATTPKTHDIVMGLGEDGFDRALSGVRSAVALKRTNPAVYVTISMVLTADNVHEAVDFVALGNQLGVDTIYLRTLFPLKDEIVPGLNYHRLAPREHPKYQKIFQTLREEIALSEVRVEAQPETWEEDSLGPNLRAKANSGLFADYTRDEAMRKFGKSLRHAETVTELTAGERVGEVAFTDHNPYGRNAPFDCAFVYHNLVTTELSFRVNPCCYMGDVPGHKKVVFDGSRPFWDYWNSEAFVFLRQSLRDGPLLGACKVCPMQGGATPATP